MTRATLLACCRLAQERDDYKQIAHEYDLVIMELKAENELLKAGIERLKLATPVVFANFDLL